MTKKTARPSALGQSGCQTLSIQQVLDLCTQRGFSDPDMATAIAMAESGGNTCATNVNTDGSIDRGLFQINSVHGALSTMDLKGNLDAAYQISSGGSNWDPWSTFHNGAFTPYLSQVKTLKPGSVPLVQGVENAITGAVTAPLKMLDLVADFVGTLLNFQKLGELVAKVIAWTLKLVFKAIWDYILAPLVHWNERAVNYYWEVSFGSDPTNKRAGSAYYQNSGLITIAFWAFGYGILWSQAEPTQKVLADSPRNTLLGRFLRSSQGQASRRHLTSPGKVQKNLPPKPEPITSHLAISRTRTLQVNRRRPVTVEGKNARRVEPELRDYPELGRGEARTHSAKRTPNTQPRPRTRPEPGRSRLDTRRNSPANA